MRHARLGYWSAVAVAFFMASSGAVADYVPPTPAEDVACAFHRPMRDIERLASLPAPVRQILDAHVGPMAERGAFFNSTDVILREAPGRRFIRAGESGSKWFVAYETGGIAYHKTAIILAPGDRGGELQVTAHSGYYKRPLCAVVEDLLDGRSPDKGLPQDFR